MEVTPPAKSARSLASVGFAAWGIQADGAGPATSLTGERIRTWRAADLWAPDAKVTRREQGRSVGEEKQYQRWCGAEAVMWGLPVGAGMALCSDYQGGPA